MDRIFYPQTVSVLRSGYSFKLFGKDACAGIITGIVALPLAIAFGIASGVSPEAGLFTAVIAGLVISLLSGSKVQIGGPTGAFIVIVFGLIQKFGLSGLAAATAIAGIIMIVMGILKLGNIIKFIPYPVTVGFTAGIAVIIAVSQINAMLGLKTPALPGDFIGKIKVYCTHLDTINYYALALCAATVLIIKFWPRKLSFIPGSFVALIAVTATAFFLKLPVETIGTKFGAINASFPAFQMPDFAKFPISEILPAAITIAMLGSIESLLSAVVADGMTGDRHHSNTELIAQGTANIIVPFFGGIPATGAIARTATNIRNGGKTPFAGIIHAVTLLLIVLCFGKLAALIPMACLAGVLLIVACNMSEYHLVIKMFRSPKSDILIFLTTFLLTVLIDLTVAIQTGVVLAAFLFMKRMSAVSNIKAVSRIDSEDMIDDDITQPAQELELPEKTIIFEINGPFFFGAASKFQDEIYSLKVMPKVVIFRMRHVPALDATGLVALEEIVERAATKNTTVIISGIQPQPLKTLQNSGFSEKIGAEHIHQTYKEAVDDARAVIASS